MDLPLAAYGTLRPGYGGAKHLGLELEDLGVCTLPGKLWLVKEMITETDGPRLVPALYPEEKGVVQARLLRVPEEAWGTLDAFEGFVPHDPEAPYLRQEIETLEGESVWAYCAQNIERINYLRDGDWASYADHPKAIPLWKPGAKSIKNNSSRK